MSNNSRKTQSRLWSFVSKKGVDQNPANIESQTIMRSSAIRSRSKSVDKTTKQNTETVTEVTLNDGNASKSPKTNKNTKLKSPKRLKTVKAVRDKSKGRSSPSKD